MALCAHYSAHHFDNANYWVFQSTHDGGPAANAGISPGDVLLSVNGREFRPPDHPSFAMEATSILRVIDRHGRRIEKTAIIPSPIQKMGQLPYVEPQPVVSHRRMNHDTGYIKVAMYPGAIGIDVANDISRAARRLNPIDRLIVDLRGNTGGGIGVLRLLSLLTPDRIPVGLYLGGKMVESSDIAKEAVTFNWIPKYKIGLGLLAVKFEGAKYIRKLQGRKTPVAVETEGLGHQRFHGRTVLLVDRHTSSANEILVSFAREHKLATIVGESTPGRLLSGEKFRLPHGYWLSLPTGEYRTSEGKNVEGEPIAPDVAAPFELDRVREGKDTQLVTAFEVVSRMQVT
jgi:C-terminal processing protease CtpA/Prc